eukprot:15441904-Alexandrium_andersonii.AAC.2
MEPQAARRQEDRSVGDCASGWHALSRRHLISRPLHAREAVQGHVCRACFRIGGMGNGWDIEPAWRLHEGLGWGSHTFKTSPGAGSGKPVSCQTSGSRALEA